MNTKASWVSVVKALSGLSDEELSAIADKPEILKEFAAKRLADIVSNTYVFTFSDIEASSILFKNGAYGRSIAETHVGRWRKYASDLGYTGPVAWKAKAGYTLKEHASRDKNYSNINFNHLQNWELKNDEPTKESLVFWIPRLAKNSTNKTITEMKGLYEVIRRTYGLYTRKVPSFGSTALLFALTLAHFKRTGERVPMKYLYAASDTFLMDGHRLLVGRFDEYGLLCCRWNDVTQEENVGFFLLEEEELRTSDMF